MPEFISELAYILRSHSPLIDIKKSLHVLFTHTIYGCEKDYPVAIVHERKRIKEASALAYFRENDLLDKQGFSYEEYPRADLENIAEYSPKYIQTVGFMLASNKDMPQAVFFNKFTHDFWKKIRSSEGLESVIDISALSSDTSQCQAEEALRAIIRKRKEVHQLKKISFVWIVEIVGKNPHISTVMKHYFEENTSIIEKKNKTYYLAWSTPLQGINMRYFVCPPA